jgi:hypothetical protein
MFVEAIEDVQALGLELGRTDGLGGGHESPIGHGR